ncbi:MAG: sigma-70 family RNA polymerase sigma factor [Luteolibacter sp.]|uniref:RNA polymerase sigma factor n=1 Tax=Luteolibacter sp. TaxID=1962973 RepID=UPI003266CF2C
MQTFSNSTLSSAADEELLASFSSTADNAAFSELVRRHLPLVLAVTRRRLGNSGLAEDAAQQVFIALSRAVKKRCEIPCLAAWLQKAAVFEASNLARKETRHRRRAEQATDLWAEPSSRDDSRLDQALAKLPERDRQILVLHYYEKLPFARVASRLGISEAAAQRGGHRALEKLAKILRPQTADRDAGYCALWLAGSLVPAGTSVPNNLVVRISTLKKVAAYTLPWLPVAAVLTLGCGIWATVAVTRPSAPPPFGVANRPSRGRPAARPFKPQIADENLNDEVREFISRAKADSKDAWEWAKQRPIGAVEFFNRNMAIRALADRDLRAAERFLAVIDGIEPRGKVIGGIFASKAGRNFESAILWLESVPENNGLRGIDLIRCDYMNSEAQDYDYAGALGFAQIPKLREWLIRQVCEKAAAIDETGIEKLALGLKGEERQIALGYATSLLLQRGDPRAFELLDQVKLDLWKVPNIDKVALRDPQELLEWVAAHDEAGNRDKIAGSVWRAWCLNDATAAVAWAKGLDGNKRHALGVDNSMDATAERLFKQP